MPSKIITKLFSYTSYKPDFKNKKISFDYKIEFANSEPLFFTEEILLPDVPDIEKIPQEILKNILEGLHLMLGISYYKTFCPPKIKLPYKLAKEQAVFWNTVYRKGLGEFCYRNKINPAKLAKFTHTLSTNKQPAPLKLKNRSLVGIGGGKDSIVAVELLKKQNEEITGFIIETQKESKLIRNVAREMKIPALKIRRQLDQKLVNKIPGSFDGHIPISAIIAFLGVLSAILYDYSNIIVANEHSSNFGNLKWKEDIINHQWSKSSEFETLFQNYVKNYISPDIKTLLRKNFVSDGSAAEIKYFSVLRMFSELRIAKLFSLFKNYFPVFSSCNKNFQIKHEQQTLWCGQCPKCAFVFLILAPFLPKDDLLNIFGKNLFEDKNLLPLFKDILGFGKMKPFDCVGTFEEAQAALVMASQNFQNSLMINEFLPAIQNPKELIKNALKTNSAQNTPAYFLFLGLENVLILGYGKEGIATKQYLKNNFPDIQIGIADQKHGPDYLKEQDNFDLAIKTPGMPKELVKIPYTTATNIFFSRVKNIKIGITGTKGKSTTSSLIYEILIKAGKKARLVGNIGNPMINALSEKINPDEIFIAELSSYQLDDLRYSPDIAVILNLFPDHMTYHGSAEKYYQAKKNIINFQTKNNYFIFNPEDKKLSNWAKSAISKAIPLAKNIPLKDAEIPLIGEHNKKNIKAAISVARVFGISDTIIAEALKSFKPLPHRLEFIGRLKDIDFYDDAISTTPESTIAAIESLPKIGTIFLGGENRGYDFLKLEKTIRKYKIINIVLFPDSGKNMFRSKNGLKILETDKMEEAIKFAYQNTKKGSICLLSTASPSYSLWKNFEEKGEQFKFFARKHSRYKH